MDTYSSSDVTGVRNGDSILPDPALSPDTMDPVMLNTPKKEGAL